LWLSVPEQPGAYQFPHLAARFEKDDVVRQRYGIGDLDGLVDGQVNAVSKGLSHCSANLLDSGVRMGRKSFEGTVEMDIGDVEKAKHLLPL
jgi:hypothetical protein